MILELAWKRFDAFDVSPQLQLKVKELFLSQVNLQPNLAKKT
jgi:hypothetical protein